jgi:hypothetical protein
MTNLPRVAVGFLALLLGALFATSAEAAAKRIGVPKFDGVQEALVRKKVMQIIKAHGFDLAKSREMEIGLANTGALLDNDEGFAKVAKELALAAIVTGEIGKKRAKIAVHDGKDGSVIGEASFAGANPRKMMAEVGKDFWRKLGDAIERGKTPSGAKKPQKVVAEAPEDNENTPDAAGGGEGEPAPEPTKSRSKKEAVAENEGGGGGEGEEAPKKKKKKKKLKMDGTAGDAGPQEEAPEVIPATFDFQAGFRAISRSLSYNQDASVPGLRTYSLFPGPALYASILWYPIGPFTDGAAKDIGFEASIEQAFAVSSSLPGMNGMAAQKFGTTIHEFAGGARYRVPWGPGNYFYGSVTGGEHAFTFSSTSTGNRSTLDIPDTIYRYVRPGVGVHFELPASLSLGLSAGFRWVFNKGGQFHDQFFKQASVNGVDAGVVLAYRVSSVLEARLAGDIRRYFSSMNCFGGTDASGNAINQCSPQFTAGGAVDQYISGMLTVAVTVGGTERVSAEEAEEPPPPPKRKRKSGSEEEEPPLGNDVKSDGGGEE